MNRNANPQLLNLLRMGCKVEFPTGAWLRGDKGYIKVGSEQRGELGAWSLDREGLRNAMSDKDLWAGND
jgi:hypothetical protein